MTNFTGPKFETFTTEERGRGVRATADVKAGDEIISEQPICHVLMNKCRGNKCDYCFEDLRKSLKCSRCKFVFYCDQKCQRKDWPTHKRECKCIIKVSPRQPPDLVRLASQLLYKYFWNKNSNDDNNDNLEQQERSIINNLMDHKERITSERKEAFFTFGAVLMEYIKGCPVDLEAADVYGLLCKISCNSYSITNSELNSLGTGMFKVTSFMNHSCDPNCCATFSGTEVSVRAMKNIEYGEELCVSYTDLMAPTVVRQRELMEGYMFTCTCPVCTDDVIRDHLLRSSTCKKCSKTRLPVLQTKYMYNIFASSMYASRGLRICSTCDPPKEEAAAYNDDNDENIDAFIAHSLTDVADSSCDMMMDSLDAVYNTVNVVPTPQQQNQLEKVLSKAASYLSPYNLSVLHACEIAMDGCLESGDWKKALAFGLTLEKAYHVYLTDYHPTLGIHYFKQGKLQMIMGELKEGIASLLKSKRILLVTHGKDHSLLKELDDQLSPALMEMRERDNWDTMEGLHAEGDGELMVT